MKKLNLEKLKLAAEDVPQRNQMTTIYRGSGDGCQRYDCDCLGSIGSWEGTYCSLNELRAAIITWCASGEGSCSAQ
jgi:hypothetical protein